MTGRDLRKLAVFLHNLDTKAFCRLYGKDVFDHYVEQKYRLMQVDPLRWIGELDSAMLEYLAEAINNYEGA